MSRRRLESRSFLVFTTIIFITSLEAKPRAEASRDCANPEQSNFEQSVAMGRIGPRSDQITKEENVTNSNVVMATIFEEFESRLSRLERRLRAIEQPGKPLAFFSLSSSRRVSSFFLCIESATGRVGFTVWQMSSDEEDWEICAEGPCRCQPEIKLVSCWRQDLLDLPAAQLVPRDVLKL